MVGELVRSGLLTPEEALRHPYRNVITRALGTGAGNRNGHFNPGKAAGR